MKNLDSVCIWLMCIVLFLIYTSYQQSKEIRLLEELSIELLNELDSAENQTHELLMDCIENSKD